MKEQTFNRRFNQLVTLINIHPNRDELLRIMQEQVTDGKNWFGWGIQPASKAVIGSLQVPYIYEDRISKEDFIKTLKKALNLSAPKYKKLSELALNHIHTNYNFENYEKSWIDLIDETIKKHGSWENRINHKRWYLMEVA